MNSQKLTYISLFSSAGVGCYGFKMEGFECIATNELIERRLRVQQSNNKCKYQSGYILGDITQEEVKNRLLSQIDLWHREERISDVTAIIATPPCQGMSVANHKRSDDEIVRNSLVVQSITLVDQIRPQFFIFENVAAFMKTACTDIDGQVKAIEDVIQGTLGDNYTIYGDVINFKNYGSNSSRTRTIVIGVRKDFADFISPIELFPTYENREVTLREVIDHLPRLKEWGIISDEDIYHGFRVYPEHMRAWISDLKEGQSAFDNSDPLKIPHQVKDGQIVYNKQKNGDKYTRQIWDKVAPCIHTRNDQLASQNTIHPEDDRVFSIRELMLMMTIPETFKWVDTPLEQLNTLSVDDKRKFLKKEEIKIRQSIGEAVPTEIFKRIAQNIRLFLSQKHLRASEVNKLITSKGLMNTEQLKCYIKINPDNLGITTLSRIAELVNSNRTEHAAYYTNKFLTNEVVKSLPKLEQKHIRILEPSVGVGNFLAVIVERYQSVQKLTIDVVDIDKNSLEILKLLVDKMNIPSNVKINYICDDFLKHNFLDRYDLVVGNPPFSKLKTSDANLSIYREGMVNQDTTNTFAFFLEKACRISDYVAMIIPKFLLNTPEFYATRQMLENMKIDYIMDFGEYGFKGVLVETICISIDTVKKPTETIVVSMPNKFRMRQLQRYIMDSQYPYWIIYRDAQFDKVAETLIFNVFDVFRDRQITNSIIAEQGDIRVLKSRNISDNGTEIINIEGYDAYIDKEVAQGLGVYKYIDADNVYLTPNMTYKPRVIKKPKGVLVNGSAAILIPKDNIEITHEQMLFFASDEYREFYKIARNYQTRSLNVDANSVYFFGLLKGK